MTRDELRQLQVLLEKFSNETPQLADTNKKIIKEVLALVEWGLAESQRDELKK